MNIQRQEIGRELSEKVSEISFKMDETDRQIQQLEDYNKQSSQLRAQRTQLMADKKEKAIKASAVKVQQLQAQLVQAGENAKTQHASTKKALLDVTQAKNKANAQLLALGAEDKDSSSTSEKSTMEDIQTYNTYVVNFDDFSKGECCNPTSKNDLCSTAKTIGESGKVNVNGSK